MNVTVKKHPLPPIDISDFHLSDKSKAELTYTARVFHLTLDELVERAIKDIATCETRCVDL